jgi:hypothetical protein
MTWVYGRFNALPYLRFLGDSGCGKTKMAEVTAAISYRATMGGVATTAAVLFRLCDQYRGTLFADEADYTESDLTATITQVLNAGYKRGGVVCRCDKDNNVEAFQVYGPKLLTTRKRFGDVALESRCLTLQVVEKANVRDDIKFHLLGEFYKDWLHLRNQLLTWRLRNTTASPGMRTSCANVG